MRRTIAGLACVVLLLAGLVLVVKPSAAPSPVPLPKPTQVQSPMTLISHAGSGLPEGAYSNSLQALERAVADNLELVEVDLSWTGDGTLVLIHDWERTLDTWFDLPLTDRIKHKLFGRERPETEADFLGLTMRAGLTQMTFADLMTWLDQHPEIRLVTDVREDNQAALALIAKTYPASVGRIIPQIYGFDEYDPARALGFTNIIFTGYKSDASNAQIVAFAEAHELVAVTLPLRRLTLDGLAEFEQMQAPLWTHTVNDPLLAGWLSRAGVDGLYTDSLLPF